MPYSKGRPIDIRYGSQSGRETGRLHMKKWISTLIAAAVFATAAGCSADVAFSDPPGAQPSPPSELGGLPTDAATAVPGGASAPTASQAPPAAAESAPEPDDAKNVISVASPQTETIDATPISPANGNGKQPASTEPGQNEPYHNYDVEGSFNPSHPTLMGMGIGNKLSSLTALHGEPTNKYLLPDDNVRAAVFAYPGFAVGVRDGEVLFVEVASANVNPGLGGVKIGDKKDHALYTLGKPTTSNDFVVSYIAGGVVLKFDIDPDTGTIQSIKLFPEE